VPRVQRSKLANPCAENALPKSAKPPFNTGKKRLTGPTRSSTHARRAELSRNSDPVAVGTGRAIKGKVLSAATIAPAASQVTRRSDPKIGESREASQSKVDRNRSGRRSTALRLSEVRNIMAAAVFTAQEHRPLNRHTTIHFDKAGIADPVAALRSYTKLARDWLATKGAVLSYIWVRESGDRKGEHAHLLMHVPANLASVFARRERGWRKLIGAKRARGAFRSTAVGRSYRHAEVGIQYGEHYADHLRDIVGYLVKGAEQRAVKALQLTRVAPGGELSGKRTGMSENINRTARARASI
jgi:hypothetical protein